jgi:hypothetical protein
VQRDKFAKKLEDKLAKKDQDALAKTEKVRRKKGFGMTRLQTKTN